MKAVARALYAEPIVFLAVLQAAATALAAAHLVPIWIPVVSLAIITPLQRYFVAPAQESRGRRR